MAIIKQARNIKINVTKDYFVKAGKINEVSDKVKDQYNNISSTFKETANNVAHTVKDSYDKYKDQIVTKTTDAIKDVETELDNLK